MRRQSFISAMKTEFTLQAPKEFELQLLKHITNHFSEESIIGHGGSGIVYKGVLDNGEEIAMKKLHQMSGLDNTHFTNEVNNLMLANHKNIIRLLGYCNYQGLERAVYEGEYVFAHVEERLLIYEYLQGGNLNEHLSDELCGLDWDTRYKIIKGVCKGLNFLHTGSKDPICHLDLKPENILLDRDMIPKIADFGLSRLFTHTHMTKIIRGTFGYMPPEFLEKGKITPKFDIFSLGVIIIKIIAGPDGYTKFRDTSSQEFNKLVQENWAKRLHETKQSLTLQEIKTCMDIASRCVEWDEKKRPCISEIINELNEKTQTSREILYTLFSPRCMWVNGPIIVGAGPSGLAVAASLREHDVPFVMLERDDCIASLWQKRTYGCLKLNRPKQFCELPGMPLPDHFPEFLTRAHFIDYIEQYAAKFDIKPEFNITVLSARFDETCGLWRMRARVDADEMDYMARWLVVASGINAEPVVPEIPGLSDFCGKVTHSSDYIWGQSYIGKRVLVVGCGQSGMEVSVDLCIHGAFPFMVVRNGIATLYLTVLLVRWLPLWLVDKIMALLANWLVLGVLARLGIRIPTVDSLTLKMAEMVWSGEITVVPGVTRFTKSGAVLSDGSVVGLDAVILSTGYRSNVTQWMQGTDLFGEDGWPKTSFPDGRKGRSWLYSVGFTRCGLLGAFANAVWVAKDLAQTWKEETTRTTRRRRRRGEEARPIEDKTAHYEPKEVMRASLTHLYHLYLLMIMVTALLILILP